MKRSFYLLLIGLLMFSSPAIATTTGSVEKEVVVDIDIGQDTEVDVLFTANDYVSTAEVKRSDGKQEYLYFTDCYMSETTEVTFSDKHGNTTGNENRPYLNDAIKSLSLTAYRKARDGLMCSV